jgi:type 1 glutamine amidotransferase
MTNGLNRRGFLKGAGVGAAALLASTSPLAQWASAQDEKNQKTKKVLFFTRSAGFEHPAITRKDPEKLSFAENWLTDFGKTNNFEVTCTKDGAVFTEEGLAPYDVIMFYTTGILDGPADPKNPHEINRKPMPEGGKATFLKAIADGKGFIGVHSSTDTFHGKDGAVDPYIKMIGGEFLMHNAQEPCRLVAVDENWGPIKGLKTFTALKEEWYRLKNVAPDMQVLLWQDTSTMKQAVYNTFAPYPETWARMHGKGRVFYTSMGHEERIWKSPEFSQVLLGGLQWTSRNADGEVKPNAKEVTPKALFRDPDAAAG